MLPVFDVGLQVLILAHLSCKITTEEYCDRKDENMKNKTLALFIASVVAALLLCGCGEDKSGASAFEKMKDKTEQQALEQKPEEPEKESAPEEEIEEKEENSPEDFFAKAVAEGLIENNGGLFVKVANRVYFRIYDKRALCLTTMGDSFIDEVREDCPSKLMYFDLDTDKTVEAGTMTGIGPLFATKDGICVSSDLDESTAASLTDESRSEVYLSNVTYGDLVCRTSDDEEKAVYKDYIYDPGEGAMFRDAIEGAVCFDNDSLFLIKVNALRAPEEDMGGRMAFDLEKLSFECYRFDDAHKSGNDPQYFNLGECSSTGWASGEIGYDRLIGSWQCTSAIVEGFDYQVYKDSSTVEVITFNEDGSAVISHIDKSSGQKVSDDRNIHKAQPEDPEYAPDYAYYYETDDADPEKIGICYLTHGRLGIYHLYHYDGTSTGWYMGAYHKVKE